jgi:hypothetical protein
MFDQEVSDHDLADQHRSAWSDQSAWRDDWRDDSELSDDSAWPDDGEGRAEVHDPPLEAEPADVYEQHIEVPLVEDDPDGADWS